MDQKTISWISYITIVGWIIAIVSYNGAAEKSALAKFHLRQSLGLNLTWMIIYSARKFTFYSFGALEMAMSVLSLGLFILWLLGFIYAIQGQEKPVPILGDVYQKLITFIN